MGVLDCLLFLALVNISLSPITAVVISRMCNILKRGDVETAKVRNPLNNVVNVFVIFQSDLASVYVCVNFRSRDARRSR